jgi:hypothetical protein
MKTKLFKEPELQKAFDKDGFVIVDMLTPAEVEGLKGVVKKLSNAHAGYTNDSNYKLSFFSDDPEYRKLVFDTIYAYCRPLVDRYLDDYEPIMINTFGKEVGKGEVPIHQNWSFVDESKHTSVSVWIPLVDTTRINGTMEVVKGSHAVLSPYRGPTIPWVFQDLFEVIKTKHMEAIDTKLGQAVILDDSIIHYTSQNDSKTVRGTVQLIMKPKVATAIHYHRSSENSNCLEVFEVDSAFFTRFQMGERPTGVPKVAEVPFQEVTFTEEAMLNRIKDRA